MANFVKYGKSCYFWPVMLFLANFVIYVLSVQIINDKFCTKWQIWQKMVFMYSAKNLADHAKQTCVSCKILAVPSVSPMRPQPAT